MDPATIMAAVKFIGQALATAGASQAVASAVPKTSINPAGAVPDSGDMDLNKLVGGQQQQQSMLPKLQLQNRLPRPY